MRACAVQATDSGGVFAATCHADTVRPSEPLTLHPQRKNFSGIVIAGDSQNPQPATGA